MELETYLFHSKACSCLAWVRQAFKYLHSNHTYAIQYLNIVLKFPLLHSSDSFAQKVQPLYICLLKVIIIFQGSLQIISFQSLVLTT